MRITQNAQVFTLLSVGVALWANGIVDFKDSGVFSSSLNPATLKGSPYGKVLALALQGPIGVYFHSGASHETSKILGEAHEHSEECGCDEEHEPESQAGQLEAQALREKAKDQIKKMRAYAHRKTDAAELTQLHEKYLQAQVEDKLKFAHELDPSNYTNYANYHLFLSVSSLGKSERDEDAAVAMARQTLKFCKKDKIDPASWLTAASAAYNITEYIGRNYEQYGVSEARESLEEFDKCIAKYRILLDEASKKGLIVSPVRFDEMTERARYLTKLREAQGVYIKRMMSRSRGGLQE